MNKEEGAHKVKKKKYLYLEKFEKHKLEVNDRLAKIESTLWIIYMVSIVIAIGIVTLVVQTSLG